MFACLLLIDRRHRCIAAVHMSSESAAAVTSQTASQYVIVVTYPITLTVVMSVAYHRNASFLHVRPSKLIHQFARYSTLPVLSMLQVCRFYRAMLLVQSADGIAIVSRPSVCLSVCDVDVSRSYWVSSKVITRIISLGSLLLGALTSAIYSKIRVE